MKSRKRTKRRRKNQQTRLTNRKKRLKNLPMRATRPPSPRTRVKRLLIRPPKKPSLKTWPNLTSVWLLPDGETLDLASSETAAAVKAPDPYFKVGGTTYRFFEAGGVCAVNYPGDPNCHDGEGADVIQDAIDYIQANGTIPSDRKIYVEGAHTYTGFTVNGSLANLSDIRGIIGVDGSANTTLTGDVIFHDLTGGFTLQGFTINGGVTGSYVTGTVTLKDLDITNGSGNGITLEANIDGAVVIEDVKSNGNSGAGADIDNQDNAKAYNVTVKNSTFDHNDDGVFNVFGLEIVTLGKVKLENVSASHNRGAGVSINSDFSSLTVEDASFVNNDSNPNHGAFDFGLLADTNAKATITLKNVYITDSNDTDGALQLSTAGNVTLRNTYVERNAGGGANIDNTLGTGYVKVYDSTFNENLTGSGLFIISNGSVYLSSIQANNNLYDGLFVDNCQQSGGACTGTKTVTVTSSASKGVFGANNFSGNGSFGLYIESGRNISLSNISANNNGIGGMYAITTIGSGSISLKKTIKSTDYIPYSNTAINNGDHGVFFNANGSITVEYLIASENALTGASLDSDDGTKSGNITVKYSEFTMNNRQGLAAYSSKNINLTNIIVNGNGLSGTYHGAYLYTLNSTSGGVTLSSSKGFINQFNNNTQRGLYIDVVGNVKLKKLEAIGNTSGAFIDAINSASSPRSVTISYGWFDDNTSGYGFEIDAESSVKIDNVSASGNFLAGARIGRTFMKYPGTVSVKYSNFDRNGISSSYSGLQINNYKSTTLYAVSASENGFTGVSIDSCQWDGGECLGSGSVSIKSKKGVYNTFNDNDGDGLFVWASGSISISYVMAGNNDANGISVSNSWTGSKGNLTISGNSTSPNLLFGNSNMGISGSSNGTISVKYVEAFENMSGGAYFTNTSAANAKKLSVVDSSFNRNEGTGLDAYSNGNITLQGVEASDNSIFNGDLDFNDGYIGEVLSHTYQVDEWTTNVPSTGVFTLTLESMFFDAYLEVFGPNGELLYSDDNSGGGTDALISGSFTVSGDHIFRVTAMDGGGGYYELNLNSDTGRSQSYYRGVYASNSGGSGSVTVKYSPKRKFGLVAWNNNYSGLNVSSTGALNISRVEVMYNGYAGLYADNDHINEKTAKLTSVTSVGSPSYGVYLDSAGHITLNKVFSDFNEYSSGYIFNSGSSVPRYIKISNSTFSGTLDQFNDGLVIFASGAVTLSGVTAENPYGGTGVYIDNTNYDGQKVTISGKGNVFSNNSQKGLHVLSKGDISVSNFTAENNGDDGVYLYNGYGGITAQVKVSASKGFNDLVYNGNNGLSVGTNGKITVNKVNASHNPFATFLGNGGSPSIVSVTVSNSIFNNGGDMGLDIFAHGKVTLNNVTAAYNGSNGLYLDNSGAPGEDVIVKKSQFFGNAT